MKAVSIFIAFVFTGVAGFSQNKADFRIPLDKGEHFYAIEINGVTCGYSHHRSEPVEGEDLIKINNDATILQTVLGGQADVTIKSEFLVDPVSGYFISMDTDIKQGGLSLGSTINVEGDKLMYINKLSGDEKEFENKDVVLDNGSYYLFLLNDLEDDGLDRDYSMIDPMEGKIDTRHFRFAGREEVELDGNVYNSLKFKESYPSIGATADLWIDEKTGFNLRRDFSTGRKIYLTDDGVVKRIQVAKLDDVLFAKVDEVINDVPNISYLKARAQIRSAGESLTAEKLNFKGQKFTGTVEDNLIDGIFEISHERYDGSGAPGFPFDYSGRDDLKKYLEPENYIESDDPVLIEKANELTSGAGDSWEAAKMITSWVGKNISYAIPGGITASKTYEVRNGECGAHSRLVAALCRAAGIPAKFVIGCMYTNTYGGTFGQHAWNEIYMGDEVGWIPVDATAMEIDYVDSGHIRLGEKTSFNPVEMEILEYRIWESGVISTAVPGEYQKYTGIYLGPEPGKNFEVLYRNEGLAVSIPDQLIVDLNEKDDEGRWFAKISPNLYFSFDDDGSDESPYMHLVQLIPAPKTAPADSIGSEVPDSLRLYLGKYYFPAIANNIELIYHEGGLAAIDPNVASPIRLNPPDDKGMWMDEFDQNGLVFKFNDKGEVTGITVVSEVVMERVR